MSADCTPSTVKVKFFLIACPIPVFLNPTSVRRTAEAALFPVDVLADTDGYSMIVYIPASIFDSAGTLHYRPIVVELSSMVCGQLEQYSYLDPLSSGICIFISPFT